MQLLHEYCVIVNPVLQKKKKNVPLFLSFSALLFSLSLSLLFPPLSFLLFFDALNTQGFFRRGQRRKSATTLANIIRDAAVQHSARTVKQPGQPPRNKAKHFGLLGMATSGHRPSDRTIGGRGLTHYLPCRDHGDH